MNIDSFTLSEFYRDCDKEEFEEARRRLNLWLCCELDPKTAMEYIMREMK